MKKLHNTDFKAGQKLTPEKHSILPETYWHNWTSKSKADLRHLFICTISREQDIHELLFSASLLVFLAKSTVISELMW
jgi:hypothetical protein